MNLRQRRLRWLVGLCIALAALLGVGAQWHGLMHARGALQSPAHDDALAAQGQACEQCLQFAAVAGLAPMREAVPQPQPPGAVVPAGPQAAAPRVISFVAYESRAPPACA